MVVAAAAARDSSLESVSSVPWFASAVVARVRGGPRSLPWGIMEARSVWDSAAGRVVRDAGQFNRWL